MAYITPVPAGISIALAGILSGSSSGLVIAGTLQNFVADASGLATGKINPDTNSTDGGVPEPLTLGLLLTGIVGGIGFKRNKGQNLI